MRYKLKITTSPLLVYVCSLFIENRTAKPLNTRQHDNISKYVYMHLNIFVYVLLYMIIYFLW